MCYFYSESGKGETIFTADQLDFHPEIGRVRPLCTWLVSILVLGKSNFFAGFLVFILLLSVQITP